MLRCASCVDDTLCDPDGSKLLLEASQVCCVVDPLRLLDASYAVKLSSWPIPLPCCAVY
jgi:hypothetical protein